MQPNCPECGKSVHTGQHKYPDGMYHIEYCKDCGYRKETPIKNG
jgi:lysyl-tRNA synthetase class I